MQHLPEFLCFYFLAYSFTQTLSTNQYINMISEVSYDTGEMMLNI